MSLQRQINRLKIMHQCIKRKTTGTPEEFAKKIGLSRSQLFLVIAEMKDMGFPIEYDSYRQCYRYARDGEFIVGFKENTLSDGDLNNITGGQQHVYEYYFDSLDEPYQPKVDLTNP